MKNDRALLPLLFSLFATPVAAWDNSGDVTFEVRHFPNEPLDSRQHGDNLSLSAELEFVSEWDQGNQLFAFVPYLRLDQGDGERSHMDIRELTWLQIASDWELRMGIRKVFWGVTESQHLVDIINQTDLVENPDGEDKLGQPMVNLALIQQWGTLDLFLLPYFRERTYPGVKGRLRPALPVNDDALYESDDRQHHIDLALRWSHYIGDWDFALSYFDGTSREPELIFNGQTLTPYYRQIQQFGLEVQATKGSWLWKLEGIQRRNSDDFYHAATAGFEYSFYGILESDSDLGIVMEYLYDERGDEAITPFADDLMLGLRFTLNDEQSSEALIGTIIDLDGQSTVYSIEASRRLGDNWKATLEGRLFNKIENNDILYSLRNDDFLQFSLGYYF